MKRRLYMVNLIPYNVTPQSSFRPATKERIEAFKKILEDSGVAVTARRSFGTELSAACGQLAGKH
jgi:adenine C2-methylase RlmN of 23S rRNA A2503 and tRNA A37